MTGEWDAAAREVLERARRAAGGGSALAAALKAAGVGPESGAYSESAVSNWIKGRTRPAADVVLAAAALHGISLDSALGVSGSEAGAPESRRPDSDVQDLRVTVGRLEALVKSRLGSDSQQVPRLRDLTGVYPTRSDAQAAVPLLRTIAGAANVDAMGLSLNGICQGISDVTLAELIENGLTLRCLFLDPDGAGTQSREEEEGFPRQHLADITRANIHAMERTRGRLSSEAESRLQLRTYDEPIRFNITLVDEERALVQLYLHRSRGLDSPTFLIEAREDEPHGLFPVFEQSFNEMWKSADAVAV
jgi:hypothetical protein